MWSWSQVEVLESEVIFGGAESWQKCTTYKEIRAVVRQSKNSGVRKQKNWNKIWSFGVRTQHLFWKLLSNDNHTISSRLLSQRTILNSLVTINGNSWLLSLTKKISKLHSLVMINGTIWLLSQRTILTINGNI